MLKNLKLKQVKMSELEEKDYVIKGNKIGVVYAKGVTFLHEHKFIKIKYFSYDWHFPLGERLVGERFTYCDHEELTFYKIII